MERQIGHNLKKEIMQWKESNSHDHIEYFLWFRFTNQLPYSNRCFAIIAKDVIWKFSNVLHVIFQLFLCFVWWGANFNFLMRNTLNPVSATDWNPFISKCDGFGIRMKVNIIFALFLIWNFFLDSGLQMVNIRCESSQWTYTLSGSDRMLNKYLRERRDVKLNRGL